MRSTDTYPNEITSLFKLVERSKNLYAAQTYMIATETGMDDVTFQDVYEFTLKFNDYLAEHGVEKGQAVSTVFHNSTLMALFFISTIAAKRVFVPLNPKMGEGEIKHICTLTEPVLTLYANEFKARVEPVQATGKRIAVPDEYEFYKMIMARPLNADSDLITSSETDMDLTSEIVFTSGSTGLPKGAVLTHRGLLINSFGLAITFEFDENSRFLTACPLFHNSGQLFSTLAALWSGGLHVSVRSDLAMIKFWHLCDTYKLQWALVMNAFLSLLVQRREKPENKTVIGILSGGSKLKQDLVDAFEEKFDVPVYQCFGLTETTSFSTSETPSRTLASRGSAGKPLPACQIKIVNDGVEVGRGEEGEILIRGEHLFTGYIKQPDVTAEKLIDGWLHTGDLGRIDDENNVFIIDRIDSMIHVGGENIYPSEIENLSPLMDNVEDVIVTAIPHQVLGSELVFVYKAQDGKSVDPVSWNVIFTENLSTFKIPKRRVSIEELGFEAIPRAANGKLLRGKVKNAVLEKFAPQSN